MKPPEAAVTPDATGTTEELGPLQPTKARKRSAPAPTIDSAHKFASLEGGVGLVYDGKRTEKEILTRPAPRLELVLPATKGTNRLILGDNGDVLRALMEEDAVKGQVRLVYIDPPFATGWTFVDREGNEHYQDKLVGAAYLEFLRERLILLRELLAKDGSIYVHLDDKMVHYVKVVMDEVFGTTNFRNMISRQKCHSKNYTRRQYGQVTDYILFYSNGSNWVWNKPWEPWDEAKIASAEFQYTEKGTGRRYKLVPLHAPGSRNGATGTPWRTLMPPAGKHWQHTPSKLDEFEARGEIHWSKNDNPRRKVYLDQRPGAPVTDVWFGMKDPMNQHTSATGYPTEKNEMLLERIVHTSSNPGDLVLDCFAGSGTTCIAASKLGRRWVAIDSNPRAIEVATERLTNAGHPPTIWRARRGGVTNPARPS